MIIDYSEKNMTNKNYFDIFECKFEGKEQTSLKKMFAELKLLVP